MTVTRVWGQMDIHSERRWDRGGSDERVGCRSWYFWMTVQCGLAWGLWIIDSLCPLIVVGGGVGCKCQSHSSAVVWRWARCYYLRYFLKNDYTSRLPQLQKYAYVNCTVDVRIKCSRRPAILHVPCDNCYYFYCHFTLPVILQIPVYYFIFMEISS